LHLEKGEKIVANQTNGNQFREDEIVIPIHWDKGEEKWVKSIFPKIGGRLRLAHGDKDGEMEVKECRGKKNRLLFLTINHNNCY
jgi:hypothetical protein